MYIPQFNYHMSPLCFTLPLVKKNLEVYLVSSPRSQISLVSLNLYSLLVPSFKVFVNCQQSTFANVRCVQFGQPLHLTKGVTSLRVMSFRCNCRLGYPFFDTSPFTLLLVWYSLPTTYIFAQGFRSSLCSDIFDSLTRAINS
jgi:hypothetical protein